MVVEYRLFGTSVNAPSGATFAAQKSLRINLHLPQTQKRNDIKQQHIVLNLTIGANPFVYLKFKRLTASGKNRTFDVYGIRLNWGVVFIPGHHH